MTKGKVVRIEHPNGVGYNLTELDDGDPELWSHIAIHLAINVRSGDNNRNLGVADSLLGAGEWELAIEEILAVIENDPRPLNPVVQALADRAAELVKQKSESSG